MTMRDARAAEESDEEQEEWRWREEEGKGESGESEEDLTLTKDVIAKQKLSMAVLIKYTQVIFKKLSESVSGKDIVVVLGMTGAGKSTLLASVVYGPENLEYKKIQRTIGKKKKWS